MDTATKSPWSEGEHEDQKENPRQEDEYPDVLTADEVAEILRVNRKTVYAAFKSGEIPGGRRIGGTIRFSRRRVLQWLDDGQEHGSRSPRGAR